MLPFCMPGMASKAVEVASLQGTLSWSTPVTWKWLSNHACVRGEGKGKEPAAPAGCLSRQTGCWLVCPGMHTKTDIVFLCPQTVVGQGQGSKVRGHWCSNGKSCIRYACFCLHTMVGVRVRGCPLFTPSGGGRFLGVTRWELPSGGLLFCRGSYFSGGGCLGKPAIIRPNEAL